MPVSGGLGPAARVCRPVSGGRARRTMPGGPCPAACGRDDRCPAACVRRPVCAGRVQRLVSGGPCLAARIGYIYNCYYNNNSSSSYCY